MSLQDDRAVEAGVPLRRVTTILVSALAPHTVVLKLSHLKGLPLISDSVQMEPNGPVRVRLYTKA